MDKMHLVMEKPEVFIYNIPFREQRKTSYLRRSAKWGLEDPIWEGKLLVYKVESNDWKCKIQLKDSEDRVFGEAQIEKYPADTLLPVEDSNRYFTLEIENHYGELKIVGAGFSRNKDYVALKNTLISSFREFSLGKTRKLVDRVQDNQESEVAEVILMDSNMVNESASDPIIEAPFENVSHEELDQIIVSASATTEIEPTSETDETAQLPTVDGSTVVQDWRPVSNITTKEEIVSTDTAQQQGSSVVEELDSGTVSERAAPMCLTSTTTTIGTQLGSCNGVPFEEIPPVNTSIIHEVSISSQHGAVPMTVEPENVTIQIKMEQEGATVPIQTKSMDQMNEHTGIWTTMSQQTIVSTNITPVREIVVHANAEPVQYITQAAASADHRTLPVDVETPQEICAQMCVPVATAEIPTAQKAVVMKIESVQVTRRSEYPLCQDALSEKQVPVRGLSSGTTGFVLAPTSVTTAQNPTTSAKSASTPSKPSKKTPSSQVKVSAKTAPCQNSNLAKKEPNQSETSSKTAPMHLKETASRKKASSTQCRAQPKRRRSIYLEEVGVAVPNPLRISGSYLADASDTPNSDSDENYLQEDSVTPDTKSKPRRNSSSSLLLGPSIKSTSSHKMADTVKALPGSETKSKKGRLRIRSKKRAKFARPDSDDEDEEEKENSNLNSEHEESRVKGLAEEAVKTLSLNRDVGNKINPSEHKKSPDFLRRSERKRKVIQSDESDDCRGTGKTCKRSASRQRGASKMRASSYYESSGEDDKHL